jgi:hypothetical protein
MKLPPDYPGGRPDVGSGTLFVKAEAAADRGRRRRPASAPSPRQCCVVRAMRATPRYSLVPGSRSGIQGSW